MHTLRDEIETIEQNGITKVAFTRMHDPEVIPLWFGEGDVVTPDFVRDAAKVAPEPRLFGHAQCRFLLAEVKEEEEGWTRLLEEAITTLREASKPFPGRIDASYHLAHALMLFGGESDAGVNLRWGKQAFVPD